jgi:plastocyanin
MMSRMAVRWRGLRWIGGLLILGMIAGFAGRSAVIAAPAQSSSGQAWKVLAGVGTADSSVVTLQFYPGDITIDVGDSITWTAQGDAHVVAFLSGAPVPSPEDPAATAPAGGNTYDGTGIVASGVIFPIPPLGAAAAPPGVNTSYTLTFTAPGSYIYYCLIHPGMAGKVTVQPAGTPYPQTQAQYDAESAPQERAALASAVSLANAYQVTSTVDASGHTTYYLALGLGNGAASTMRFLPVAMTVAPGDTVVWTNTDPVLPHTVTFPGPDGKLPDFPSAQAVMPAGGSTYDGSAFTNSGLVGPAGTPNTQSYSLTFTTPGIYHYACLIHRELGQVGTIVVAQSPQ